MIFEIILFRKILFRIILYGFTEKSFRDYSFRNCFEIYFEILLRFFERNRKAFQPQQTLRFTEEETHALQSSYF